MHQYIWQSMAAALALAAGAMAMTASASSSQSDPDAADLPQDVSLLKDWVELANLDDDISAIPQDLQSLDDLPPEKQEKVDKVVNKLQSNAITNGELAEDVTDMLQAVDVQRLYESLNLDSLPGAAPLLEQLGLNQLVSDSQQRINQLAFLVDVVTFRFETESGGVTRQHFGLLNTPMRLNVDRRFGADVVATFGLTTNGSNGVSLTLKVRRTENAVGRLTGALFGGDGSRSDLPLDVRAVVDIPVDAVIGGTEPPLRVSLGFQSETGIPEKAVLNAEVQDFQNQEALTASANLTTEQPTADLSLVGSVSRENAQTRQFDKLADFGVALSPVPSGFGLDATLGDTLQVDLTTTSPTTPTVTFDAVGQATGQIVVNTLPPALSVFVGGQNGDQVVQYAAEAPIGEILASLEQPEGFDIDAALRDLPREATLNFGDGDAIDIDLGGASIGEIAFTLTDGPPPRNVAADKNGAVLDLTEGLVVGARFEGFQGLSFDTDPNLALDAMIDTPRPVVFDVDLADGSFADVDFSNFPDQVGLSLEQGSSQSDLFGATYTGSETVDNLSVATNLGLDLITANFESLPTRLDLCAAQDSGCTGQTDGNVLDASLDADAAMTIRDAFFCLAGDCANPSEYFQLSPLTFQTLELSANLGQSCINVPFVGEQCLGEGSAGQIFINTDNAPLSGDIDADLGDTEVYVDGSLQAQNRRLEYSALDAQFDRSGSMSCNPLNIDVITGGTNIGDFIDPADLLCN